MLNIATNNTIYSATNYIILFKLNEYMYSIFGVILIHFHFDGSRKLKDLTVVFVFPTIHTKICTMHVKIHKIFGGKLSSYGYLHYQRYLKIFTAYFQ